MSKKIFLCLCFTFIAFASLWTTRAVGFSVNQPSEEEMLAAAQLASSKTGIRPALLLGVFAQETGFGSRLGKTKTEWEAYCQKSLNQYKSACIAWKNKDCRPDYSNAKGFSQICATLGYSTDQVKTSQTCALGFMQVEPATWLHVQSKHNQIRNPWKIDDAFGAAGYYLAELGGTQDEKTALQKYYCGPSDFRKINCLNYAQDVLAKAKYLEKFAAGEEPLPPLSALPRSTALYELQLEYPEWFPLRAGMSLVELVGAIFNMLLTVAGVAAFFMIAAGGFRYLTSLGNPAKMADAKDQVFNAITGLVLLLASFLILNTINPQLVKLTEPETKELATAPEPVLPTPPPPPEIKAITPINLGQEITKTIEFLNANNVVGAMSEFANLAKREKRRPQDNCQGHSCDYQFVVRREITLPGCDPCDECCNEIPIHIPWGGIWNWCADPCIDGCCSMSYTEITTIIEEPYYGEMQTCIPPLCNTTKEACPDPNAENGINTAIAEIETAVEKGLLTENDKLALNQAKEDINKCVSGTLLEDDPGQQMFSCERLKIWFEGRPPEDLPAKPAGYPESRRITVDEVNNCRPGRDFYCISFGETTEKEGLKITFPIEPLKQAYEAIDKLVVASEDCQCENVDCTCTVPEPPLLPNEGIVNFWCQPDEHGCRTKGGNEDDFQYPPGPYECEAPCEKKNQDSPFAPGFGQKKDKAERIAGPKPGEPGDDGLRQFYTTLAAISGQVEMASQGQGLYLCEDIKSMLESYYKDGTCPSYDIFPCCPPATPDGQPLHIGDCTGQEWQPTDFFVCGEVTGGPVIPPTPPTPPAPPEPEGPPWPMACDTEKIPDCTGLIQSSKQWDDATQVLKDLINCIYNGNGDISRAAPIDPGPITVISDPNIPGRGGTDGCEFKECAFTLFPEKCSEKCGESNNPNVCLEKCNSWHYGGVCTGSLKPNRGTAFSYAVELKDRHKLSDDDLEHTIISCGGQIISSDTIMVEMGTLLTGNPETWCPD